MEEKNLKMIKIGNFAKMFNISIKTIRYYESIGLIVPCFVDNYSGYRYFDEENIKRLQEIILLKELGFSLEEIKYFNENEIQNKIYDYENKILNLKEQIDKLKVLAFKGKEVLKMKKFVNDERVIGKWSLLGIAEDMDKAKQNKFEEDDFAIKDLYLMPDGKEYWVIHWTKDYIYINGKECSYELLNNKMYLIIKDNFDEDSFKVAVYEKVDDKEYSEEEIKIKDDINVPFVEDENIVGFWHTIDFINNPNSFNPNKRQWDENNLSLQKLSFDKYGNVLVNYKGNNYSNNRKYTKNYIIDLILPNTLSKYTYQNIDGKNYIVVEWKSGDYVFGKVINGYYVLEKE